MVGSVMTVTAVNQVGDRPLRASVKRRLPRSAELGLNSLCVATTEIFFFPRGKIQICLRRKLGVFSLCSVYFRAG